MTSRAPARGSTSSKLWPAAAVVLWLAVAGCSSGSESPTIPTVAATPTTAAAQTGETSSSATTSAPTTPLEKAQAYAKCMRSHGVANFPDPVATPSGGYGFRTQGVDPKSSAFQSASEACDELVPGGWGEPGKALTPADQQEWLDWARCIRTHGVPDFADPTFSGQEVHISGDGDSPQLQSAMADCKSKMPTTGGLGG
ncbi:MAG: hypothetical protein JWN67_3370 [Actinomycetia bacterium]|nr:hypothetical protein [Actinomycetes bacterium]